MQAVCRTNQEGMFAVDIYLNRTKSMRLRTSIYRLYLRSAPRLPLGRRWNDRLHAQQERQREDEWFRRCWAEGSEVHRSIEFRGQARGYLSVSVGAGAMIERDVTIWISADSGASPEMRIGAGAFIGRNCYLGAYQPVIIGDRVGIGAYSYIISEIQMVTSRSIIAPAPTETDK